MARIFGVKSNSNKQSSIITKSDVQQSTSGKTNVSSGIITPHTTNNIPSGWLLCDGLHHSKIDYASLYSIIGDTYNTHPSLGEPPAGYFRVPDLRDVFPIGASPSGPQSLGSYNTSGWNHTHTVPAHSHTLNNHQHSGTTHQHTVPTHYHTFSHTHTVNSHYHDVPDHSHTFGHAHSTGIVVNISHRHAIYSDNNSNNGYDTDYMYMRRGDSSGSTNNITSGYAKTTISGVSITVGSGTSNLTTNGITAFNTGSSSDSLSDYTFVSNYGIETYVGGNDSVGVSVNSVGTFSETGTNSCSASATINTNTDGASTTGSANPPYFGINFIIKI